MSSAGRELRLVAVGEPPWDPALRRRLGDELAERFRVRPGAAPDLPADPAWETGAGQWHSDAVLDALIEATGGEQVDGWVLGATGHDLGAPDREFVFGQATVGGHWALISTARLGEPSGTHAERRYARILKEAVHELGHVAGLSHCPRERCVMSPSATPADIDRKDDRFCIHCLHALDRAMTPA